MATFIDFHNLNTEQIERVFSNAEKTSGICIFIDICGSTEIKYNFGFKEWIVMLKNTFGFINSVDMIKRNVIKFIGDEVMVFIPESDLKNDGFIVENYYILMEELYATLDIIKNMEFQKIHLQCKASLHYCEDVYNVTFFDGYNDYYGKDIDLTARFMKKTTENRIVISEEFYKKVLSDMKDMELPDDTGCLKDTSQVFIEDFKGIPNYKEFRVLDIK